MRMESFPTRKSALCRCSFLLVLVNPFFRSASFVFFPAIFIITSYDRLGEAGLSERGGMGGMDPQDLFLQLFGGGAGGFFGAGAGRSQGPRKGKDLVHRIAVSLEDLYKGKATKLALNKTVICTKCNGKGGKEGAVKSCGGCNGRGVKVTLRQLGPMLQQIQQPCNECDGKGEVISLKDRCKSCLGKKVTNERKFLEVNIDKGMKNGQTITFSQAADEQPGVVTGDVVIVVEEKPHEVFRREGNDLFIEAEVDLLPSLAGGSFSVQHLDDHALHVIIHPGEVLQHGGSDLKYFDYSWSRVLTPHLFRYTEGHSWPGHALVSTPRNGRSLRPG